jgi:hypothetical protein
MRLYHDLDRSAMVGGSAGHWRSATPKMRRGTAIATASRVSFACRSADSRTRSTSATASWSERACPSLWYGIFGRSSSTNSTRRQSRSVPSPATVTSTAGGGIRMTNLGQQFALGRVIVCVLLMASPGNTQQPFQQSYGPLTVNTAYGSLVFQNVTLWKVPEGTGKLLPWFNGDVENKTGTVWRAIQLKISFRCSDSSEERSFVAMIPTIRDGSTTIADLSPAVGWQGNACLPKLISIAMVDGTSDRKLEEEQAAQRASAEALRLATEQVERDEEEAERRRLAKERLTERKVQAKRLADEKAYAAYLSKFPTIDNGADSVFIGSDRKCSEQFVQAVSLEGLEKRKRLADLISYGCGFVEDRKVHAVKIQTVGAYCLVRLVNGKRPNDSGWVPCTWFRP